VNTKLVDLTVRTDGTGSYVPRITVVETGEILYKGARCKTLAEACHMLDAAWEHGAVPNVASYRGAHGL
jgi:hypothetical protein